MVALPSPAIAFPPYRSTDADTAALGVLETRLGLVRLQQDGSDDRYSAPLLRLNLGVSPAAELILESEYDLEEDRLGDGAVGAKLVARRETLSYGLETLALLPVNSTHSGLGAEAQLLATWRNEPLRIHANAGGFYDPRTSDIERGWRASMLAEVEQDYGRPGLELFAVGDRTEWAGRLGCLDL
jgi:hypothetical protein